MNAKFLTSLLCSLVFLTSAAPKLKNQHNFRNLYVDPIGGIQEKPQPKIIGGREAEPHSIPYQVFLEVSSFFESWYCGGSLISANYVLTAGHCGVMGIEAMVILGAHNVEQDEDSQLVVISKDIQVHEDYNEVDFTNDLALIKLPFTISFSSYISPVTLPSDASNSYEGYVGKVSGWGLTVGDGDTISAVLNYVENPILSNDNCRNIFSIIQPSHICLSGDNSRSACNGDSGGPLTVGGVQVGIVSFGVRYCLSGYPSGFSRISSYLFWIRNHSDV